MDLNKITNLPDDAFVNEISEADLLREINKETPPVTPVASSEPVISNTFPANNGNFANDSFFNDTPNASLNVGKVLDAKFIVIPLDALLTSLAVILVKYMGIRDTKKSDYATTAAEREALSEALQDWLNSLNIILTPFEKLMYAILCIYGGKIAIKLADVSMFGNEKDLATASKENERRGRPKGSLGKKNKS